MNAAGIMHGPPRTCLAPTNVQASALDSNLWVFCLISYHLATPAVAALAKTEHIYKEQKFSDHAPMTVDYDLAL